MARLAHVLKLIAPPFSYLLAALLTTGLFMRQIVACVLIGIEGEKYLCFEAGLRAYPL